MLGAIRSFLERRFARVLREPPSVRVATGVIVSATAVVVVGSGVLIWALDHSEYPNVWVGMWWALQTVTTVGYGDVSPTHPSGRIIASFVMFYGVAFVTVFIAVITSIFVARASKERGPAEGQAERIEARLEVMDERLGRLEDMLRKLTAA
jgi:voltage-gated potassium channel